MTSMTYEDYLNLNGMMTYSTMGNSMLPLIRQSRDLFTVKKKGPDRCRKYDVVLYRRQPSVYVLHRIIKVRENDYVVLGDNCISKEYGITDDDIIGVLTAVVRNGKNISVNDLRYKLYVHLWCAPFFIRILILRVLSKVKRKIKNE